MKISLDHLPRTAQQLVDLIGLPATLALVSARGGRVIWPARYGAGREALEEILGKDAAETLSRYFREELSIPKCDRAVRAVLHDEIRAEYDRMLKKGTSARRAIDELAGKYGYTTRWLWDITGASVARGQVVELRQEELF